MEERRRGPYKRYENDPKVPIPRQTLHSQRRRQQLEDGAANNHEEYAGKI